MDKIKEFKISLMERDKAFSDLKENKIQEDKSDFIIKSTATLDVQEFISKNKIEEKNYENFILDSASEMYKNLFNETKRKVDSVGIWITFINNKKIESSMDLSTFDIMKKFNDVDPLKEFLKMILKN
jgi:hypothetical protein